MDMFLCFFSLLDEKNMYTFDLLTPLFVYNVCTECENLSIVWYIIQEYKQ